MNLRDYVEEGARKAGSLTALGRHLGISQPDMSNAKAMKKPIPLDACFKLAEYIGAPLTKVIAANELVTEKKEDKRNFWEHYAKAASLACLGLVLNFVTPEPANALPVFKEQGHALYYVKLKITKNDTKWHPVLRTQSVGSLYWHSHSPTVLTPPKRKTLTVKSCRVVVSNGNG